MSESSGERVAGSWSRRRLMGIGAALAAAGGGAALSACGAPGTQGGGEAANPSAQPVTVRFHSRGGAPGRQEVTLYEEQIAPRYNVRSDLKLEDAMVRLGEMAAGEEVLRPFVEFIGRSTRSLVR